MFESDDFDQVLSQFEFPEVIAVKPNEKENLQISGDDFSSEAPGVKPTKELSFKRAESVPFKDKKTSSSVLNADEKPRAQNETGQASKVDAFVSPKHVKRKIINSYFDHQSKRKFPGPAGLLTDALQEPKDESICQIELLSQDIDCTWYNLRQDLFESPIWKRLLKDTKDWNLHVDSINAIKQQAVAGNLRRRKAQIVIAFVEAVDRSGTDPLIILRDSTGTIKSTLHRDAWSTFSPYIVSEYCALILQKPTVLTTGSAFKKHYLNITLGNILAIYSSAVLKDENKTLPDGYSLVYEEEFTVIKTERSSDSLGIPLEQSNCAEELFDGLDSFFSDDAF